MVSKGEKLVDSMKATVDLTLDRVFRDGESGLFGFLAIPWSGGLVDRISEGSLPAWFHHTTIPSGCPWLWQRTGANETLSRLVVSSKPWDTTSLIANRRDLYPWRG